MTNPIQNRLRSDYDKVTRLVSGSGGTLRLLSTTGVPPIRYVIEYHCPSLVKDAQGRIVIQHCHQVELTLGLNYPWQMPTAQMLTPMFNPHVFSHNAICLGVVWNASDTLDTLVLRIGALFQLDPRVLDANSPANLDANRWVQENRSRIPLGTVSFMTGTEPAKRIQWS